MNNMYNEEQAEKIGHEDGNYKLCPSVLESNEQIFLSFPNARRGWAATTLYYEDYPNDNSLVETN